VIAWRNGAPVRLSNIGSVVNGVEKRPRRRLVQGPARGGARHQRQPGANIVQTVQLVKDSLPRLQSRHPSAITLTIVTDRTETIRASVRDVQITLIMSAAGGAGDQA